jgi:hypothetical protein
VFRQLELAAKQVEVLTQAFPEKNRLAVLWDALTADQFGAAELIAQTLNLDVRAMKLTGLTRLSKILDGHGGVFIGEDREVLHRPYIRTCDGSSRQQFMLCLR